MAKFDGWCVSAASTVGDHELYFLTAEPDRLANGIAATAAVVPSHYVSPERVAQILDDLGKSEAARQIRRRLPTTKQGRSGELGEIFATEWIAAYGGGYVAPIKRLRWKDHREMPMRGEDVIAIRQDPKSEHLRFLKAEAKSRARLTANVVADAREALDKDEGRPSPHALQFIADRLFDLGERSLVRAIGAAQKRGIQNQHMHHLLFVFSGNAPERFLTSSLDAYDGTLRQWGVGLRVQDHKAFVSAVFERVIDNANND